MIYYAQRRRPHETYLFSFNPLLCYRDATSACNSDETLCRAPSTRATISAVFISTPACITDKICSLIPLWYYFFSPLLSEIISETPFFIFFYPPRRAKQQFSDTLAMVTNLSNPDDTYLKTDLCEKCLAKIALAISLHFASFRFISQTNGSLKSSRGSQSVKKGSQNYRSVAIL